MKKRHRKPFTLSGRVTGDRACGIQEVEVLKRVFGRDGYRPVTTVPVGTDGMWSATLRSARSAGYAARPVDTALCDGRISTAVDVLVRARVNAFARTACNRRHALVGKVKPRYPGTIVKLQDRRKGRWKTIGRDRLNKKSRFRFARCKGDRVVWPQQDPRNLRGVGRV